MSSPNANEQLVPASGSYAWTGTYTHAYRSALNGTNTWNFSLHDFTGFVSNGDYSIEFDHTTGTWSDGGVSSPWYLTETSTFATTTSVSGYPQTLYLWNSTGTVILNVYDLSQSSWAQSSGGGSGATGSGTGTGTGTGTGGTATGNGDGLITVQSDGTLVFVIYASAPSGQYDIYENDMLIFSYTFTTGTEVSGTSTSYQSEFSEFSMKLGTTLVSLFPARRRKVFCNFW